MKRLGVIAGSGELPDIAINEALSQGIEVIVYSVSGKNSFHPSLLRKISKFTDSIPITRFGRLLEEIKKDNVRNVLLLGKVQKTVLFRNPFFDKETKELFQSMVNKNDYTIFQSALKRFNENQIKIIPQTFFLKSILAQEKIFTKKKPDINDWGEIKYGMEYAQRIGGLDIGQTVVVKDKAVLAVEAIEGTNACIKRAGILSNKKGAIVCKVSRENQDTRFDVPTVGIDTLVTMKKAGCRILAVEAGKTFLVNLEQMRTYAEKWGIIFLACHIHH